MSHLKSALINLNCLMFDISHNFVYSIVESLLDTVQILFYESTCTCTYFYNLTLLYQIKRLYMQNCQHQTFTRI